MHTISILKNSKYGDIKIIAQSTVFMVNFKLV